MVSSSTDCAPLVPETEPTISHASKSTPQSKTSRQNAALSDKPYKNPGVKISSESPVSHAISNHEQKTRALDNHATNSILQPSGKKTWLPTSAPPSTSTAVLPAVEGEISAKHSSCYSVLDVISSANKAISGSSANEPMSLLSPPEHELSVAHESTSKRQSKTTGHNSKSLDAPEKVLIESPISLAISNTGPKTRSWLDDCEANPALQPEKKRIRRSPSPSISVAVHATAANSSGIDAIASSYISSQVHSSDIHDSSLKNRPEV